MLYQVKTKIIFLFSLITFLFPYTKNIFAQGSVGYLFGTGLDYYNGDINEKSDKIISPTKVFKPFVRVGLAYRITSHLESTLIFFHGSIEGADSLALEKDNLLRNESFKSNIDELALHFEYQIFSIFKKRKFVPYVFGGVGVFHFNPKAELNGTWYELQPLGTEGQNISVADNKKPYSLNEIVLPLGIGISYRLSPHWRLRFDYSNHFTFTDYLDDVSTVYPDSALLASAPNGQIALLLANRRLGSSYPKTNRSRGNPKYNDSYSHFGVTLVYNPGMLHFGKRYKADLFRKKNLRRFWRNLSCPAF